MGRLFNVSFKIASSLIICLILSSICFAQNIASPVNLKQENKKQVYIPKNLDECFSDLNKTIPKEQLEVFKRYKENEIGSNSYGMGSFVIDEWLLPSKSRLVRFFRTKGIDDHNYMAFVVLNTFWRYLNNKPLDLEERIKDYQKMKKYDIVLKASDPIYVPKNLEECFSELRKLLGRKQLADFKSFSEDEIDGYHMGLGRWIRNNWGLWSGDSLLAKYFKDKGINHPDDMSGIILTSFHRFLNNKDIKLERQIKYYQDYWKYASVPKGVVSPKDGAEIDFISSVSEKDWHFIHYGVSKSDGSVWAYQYGKGIFEPNAEQKQKVLESYRKLYPSRK